MPPKLTALVPFLAALLVCPSSSAATKSLSLPDSAIVPASASPTSARVVLQRDPEHLTIQTPGRPDRQVTLSDNCTLEPRGYGNDRLCGGPRTASTIDGRVTVPNVQRINDAQYFVSLDGIGRRWFSATAWFSDRSSPLDTPVLINRATGALTDLTGFYTKAPKLSSRSYLDLDQAQPVRNLCTPVRRIGALSKITSITSLAGWTLQTTGTDGGEVTILQRCGTSKRRTLPGTAILGRGYTAWVTGTTITLQNLKTGVRRTFSVSASQPAVVSLAFSSERLLVSARSTGSIWRIGRIPLAR